MLSRPAPFSDSRCRLASMGCGNRKFPRACALIHHAVRTRPL